MNGVSADGVGQLGEDRGEGKADDREEEGGGEALDQAGPQGETAMEAKDKQGKNHGSDQGGGGEHIFKEALLRYLPMILALLPLKMLLKKRVFHQSKSMKF